jgi:hypothetical protein
MTAGENFFHRTLRESSRINWRYIIDTAIEIACVTIATFALLYCWMGP